MYYPRFVPTSDPRKILIFQWVDLNLPQNAAHAKGNRPEDVQLRKPDLRAQSTFFSYENAYAEGILRRGQETGEERSAHYGRALRRTRDAKAPGPKGLRADGRPLRCAARPMSPHRSSRRAWWIASPARNVDDSIWEERALVFTA